MDQLASIYGLPCATGDFSHCKRQPEKCAKSAGKYFHREFQACPVAELRASPPVAMVVTLEREAAVSPLEGWPDAYAAWASTMLTTLHFERLARQNQDMAAAAKTPSKKGRIR